MENYEKAERDYISGMKYKDIAKKYDVSINTVKSWKQRYEWNRNKKSMHTKTEKVCIQNQKSKAAAVGQTDDGTKETLQNTKLTIEQQMFCIYYIRTFNATQSYQKAYGCTYDSAKAHGYELLKNVAVFEEIERLKELKRKQVIMGEEDIVELQMRIAFGDIGNYVSFGQEKVPVMSKNGPVKIKNKKTGEEEMMTHELNVIHFSDSHLVDTQIIQEIKQGKDGVSIKLADKQKAIEWLSKYFQMHPQDRQRQEFDKRKLELELLKIELQTKEREEDTSEQDNFLEVLNSSAKEVWKDERLE